MTFRSAIPDFQLANPLYAGAVVSFWTVDVNGTKTTTLANLFAGPTGTTQAPNPQILDAEGKFPVAVYHSVPVIAEVESDSSDTVETGIILPYAAWGGNWTTATLIDGNKLLRDPNSLSIYIATNTYVTSGSIASDVAAGNLVLVFQGEAATIATNAANAAAASALSASNSAAALASALAAQFILGLANPNLPNGRVPTNTATLTWDLTTPGQIKANAAAAGDGTITAVKLALSAFGARSGMINGMLSQNRSGNAETFAIKTLAGTDPTAADPVYIVFQTGTGAFVVRTITAALSVTASSGSTLGAANGVPFRIWCVAAFDGATVRLGIVKTVAGTAPSASIMTLNEWSTYSSTAEGGAGAADSAQVIYSTTAFTDDYIALVGFSDWDAGLATAGTWDTAPTRVVTFGPGVPRPGMPTGRRNHVVLNTTFTSTSAGSLFDITGLSASITPSSAANLVRAVPRVQFFARDSGCGLALVRGATNIGGGVAASNRVSAFGANVRVADANSNNIATAEVIDAPATTSPTTYKVQFILQAGAPGIWVNRTESDSDAAGICRFSSSLTLEEIMA